MAFLSGMPILSAPITIGLFLSIFLLLMQQNK